MTSDAKIGLLLGLVFIFVIAFIINGLPSFGGRAQNAEAASATSFDDDTIGLADRTQSAQQLLDWQALLDRGREDEFVATVEPPAEVQEMAPAQPDSVVTADRGEVRAIYTLDNLVSGVSRTFNDVVRGLSEASEAVTMQKEMREPVPVLDIPTAKPTQPAQASPQTPTPSPTRAETPPAETRLPANLLPRTYVVQEGDVLATVAKKVYGPVEGNRLVNIRRIYSANATTLKSPDEIFVGQKLVIPPLPEAEGSGETPNPTLSENMFEKVEAVGRRTLTEISPAKPAKERWYVVQEGDNLWKIAATQLGSGVRCDEIAKMNSDILKNKDVLDIGMRLRLPLE